MPSSADQPKTMIVPPLKQICLSSYLAFLESACAGVSRDVDPILKKCFPAFIQLRMNPNPMFKRLTSSMLPALKNHLETTLSGACFSALRLAFIHNPDALETKLFLQTNPCTGSKCSRCFSLGSFQVQRIRTLMQVWKKTHL